MIPLNMEVLILKEVKLTMYEKYKYEIIKNLIEKKEIKKQQA